MNYVDVPIRIRSVANLREHWSARAARAKQHRHDTRIALMASRVAVPLLPVVVTVTRIAPNAERQPMDRDNLANGAKAAVDGIADWLGVDDGDTRIEWKYAQEVGKPREYAVRISFEEKA